MKKVLLAVAVAFIQGCTWFSIIPPEGTDHCSGWSDGVREVADGSWQYAQLSQNVYADDDDFLMKDSIDLVEEFDRPDISF